MRLASVMGLTSPCGSLSLYPMKLTRILAAVLLTMAIALPARAQTDKRDNEILAQLALLNPLEYSRPIFKIPMARTVVGPADMPNVLKLPDGLRDYAAGLLASTAVQNDPGYDWLFPQVYSHVTREILGLIDSGQLKHPDVMRSEIAQFYEVYARNAHLWRTGGTPEPAWARAERLSQKLAALDHRDGHPRHDRMWFAGVVMLEQMYAHITVDLPRVLMIIYYQQNPQTPADAARVLADMKHDYFLITPAFDRAVATVLADQWVSWENFDAMPPFLRAVIQRFGAGAAVRLLRMWAFQRFEYNIKRGNHRDALLALPEEPGFTAPMDLDAVQTALISPALISPAQISPAQ